MAKISPLAGKPLAPSQLVDVSRLVAAYFDRKPDPAVSSQRVSFGTSGHRGSSLSNSFNEAHILAISQAICHARRAAAIDGPLFIGIDTHALSRPALKIQQQAAAVVSKASRRAGGDDKKPSPRRQSMISSLGELQHPQVFLAGQDGGVLTANSHRKMDGNRHD